LTSPQPFRFADLFAGIGGFHAALEELGGRCVYATERDPAAREVYRRAWLGDNDIEISCDINDDVPVRPEHTTIEDVSDLEDFPEHEVLTAGFPCQAFSKSGNQEGILDKTRGTLFYNILRLIAAKRPKIVVLENVRNLVGKNHRSGTFDVIIAALRHLEYFVSSEPTIVSPHRIDPGEGGGPQIRDRVYILAIHRSALVDRRSNGAPSLSKLTEFAGFNYGDWDPSTWRIDGTPLPAYEGQTAVIPRKVWAANGSRLKYFAKYRVEPEKRARIEAWELLVKRIARRAGAKWGTGDHRMPGHPIWLTALDDEWREAHLADSALPGREWKLRFIKGTDDFVGQYAKDIDETLLSRNFSAFPASFRKFEWQAADARSLKECLIQLRPSGIRVKRASYAPALVAINQTPIYGREMRRITPLEAGRLQGFPDRVAEVMRDIQSDAESYKQFGNAVHVGAVKFALAQFITHFAMLDHIDFDPSIGRLVAACLSSSTSKRLRGQLVTQPAVEPDVG
jgi:DNA (cytosine-5)-methyltransferase 1